MPFIPRTEKVDLYKLQTICNDITKVSNDLIGDFSKFNVPLRTFSDVMSVLSHSIMLTDATLNHLVTYANQSFLDLTGYRLKECLGKSGLFLSGPKTDEKVLSEIEKALSVGKSLRRVIHCYKKNGIEFLNYFHLSPVFDKEARVYAHVFLIHELDKNGNIPITKMG